MKNVKLTEICTPKQWKTLSTEELQTSGFPVYGANGQIGYYNEYNHIDPTVMITCRGATCGSINISEPKSWINGNAMCLDNLSNEVDFRYLMHYLKNYNFRNVISGSAQPQITRENLSKVLVKLYDLEKQKEIATNLDKTKKIIDEYKLLITKYDTLIKSGFIEMFGDNPTENGKWKVEKLVECCISISGGNTPSMQHPEYYGGDIPFIKSGDVKNENISNGTLSLTNLALKETNAKILPKGTIIIVIRSAALLHNFRIAIATCPIVINQDLKGLQPKDNFNSTYLLWAIKLQEHKLLSKVQTMLTSHIRIEDLLDLKISIPPFVLQEKFATFVQQIDKSKFAVQKSLEKTETLYKSLMQEYFG